jgi:hypothetical protein
MWFHSSLPPTALAAELGSAAGHSLSPHSLKLSGITYGNETVSKNVQGKPNLEKASLDRPLLERCEQRTTPREASIATPARNPIESNCLDSKGGESRVVRYARSRESNPAAEDRLRVSTVIVSLSSSSLAFRRAYRSCVTWPLCASTARTQYTPRRYGSAGSDAAGIGLCSASSPCASPWRRGRGF